jgi:HAD superfamily hydrolase (TIGR01509 family)
MSQLQALIFDVDGTIADTERDGHRVAFNRAFADAGLDWEWSVDFYGELLAIAGGKERMHHYVTHYHPDFQPPTDLNDWIFEVHTAKNDHYRQLAIDGQIPLRPGVKRLMQAAKQEGIRLAIATTSDPDNVLALLETALPSGSPDWFDVIAAGDVVPRKKPAPDVYHYALQMLELNPDQCLGIEDSRQGVEAAHQVGLTTVVTVNGYTQNQDFPEAALVLDHLGEPDQPFTAIAGDPGNATYFDIALAKKLCEGASTH